MDIVSNKPQDLSANLTAVKDTNFKTHQDGNEVLYSDAIYTAPTILYNCQRQVTQACIYFSNI